MNDKYDEIAYQQMKNEYIESERLTVKEKSLERLLQYCQIPKFSINEFALMIATQFFDEEEYGLKIAEDCNLGKLEFFAIMENFEGFKEEFFKDRELNDDPS